MFKLPCMFVSSICMCKSKRAIFCCLPTDLCISPHTNMRSHVREGVKKHDIHCKPKSYKFKLLGKLVI